MTQDFLTFYILSYIIILGYRQEQFNVQENKQVESLGALKLNKNDDCL